MFQALEFINDILWSYLIIFCLLGCALYFTFRGRFLQFRLFKEMLKLLAEPSTAEEKKNKKQISSFQAFFISMASRIGTGNLAGVASALFVGGPGAIFWMWLMALLGSATAFVECTLAQLYKIKGKHSYIGGPAYYMQYGMNKKWLGFIFSILITITFAFANNIMQSRTICDAFVKAFDWGDLYIGATLSIICFIIFWGGVRYIAHVSSWIVPIMAIAYIGIAIYVIVIQYDLLPRTFHLIMSNAFGLEQVAGGGFGIMVTQGIKRGLFSNEAGEGSTPNAAATATVSHPVKQGLIQALGVFTDTILICSCTAFIILCCENSLESGYDGIQLTQYSLSSTIGPIGDILIAIFIFFFAFSSILGNYYYGEANIHFITRNKTVLNCYRFLTTSCIMIGALTTLQHAWLYIDLMMALLTFCNVIAIVTLGKQAFILLEDYTAQKKAGIKSPIFSKKILPKEIQDKIQSWD